MGTLSLMACGVQKQPHAGEGCGEPVKRLPQNPPAFSRGEVHISVVTMGANFTTVDSHIEAIKRWREVYNSVR